MQGELNSFPDGSGRADFYGYGMQVRPGGGDTDLKFWLRFELLASPLVRHQL